MIRFWHTVQQVSLAATDSPNDLTFNGTGELIYSAFQQALLGVIVGTCLLFLVVLIWFLLEEVHDRRSYAPVFLAIVAIFLLSGGLAWIGSEYLFAFLMKSQV